jgi:hypothetical protein
MKSEAQLKYYTENKDRIIQLQKKMRKENRNYTN